MKAKFLGRGAVAKQDFSRAAHTVLYMGTGRA